MPGRFRRFLVIRDLRDTLISAYFSLRHSHVIDNPLVEKWRTVLVRLSEEEGILYLLELWLPLCVIIQRSWLESGERGFPFERLYDRSPGDAGTRYSKGAGLFPWNGSVSKTLLPDVPLKNYPAGEPAAKKTPIRITAKAFMAIGETILLQPSPVASKVYSTMSWFWPVTKKMRAGERNRERPGVIAVRA